MMSKSEARSGVILLPLIISFFSFATFHQQGKTKTTGKELFEGNCAKCHGADGTRGKWGAKNLQLSTLSDDELFTIVSTGKRMMPAWNQRLTKVEIERVIDYIKTLRKYQ
jgi:cytochrome c6